MKTQDIKYLALKERTEAEVRGVKRRLSKKLALTSNAAHDSESKKDAGGASPHRNAARGRCRKEAHGVC